PSSGPRGPSEPARPSSVARLRARGCGGSSRPSRSRWRRRSRGGAGEMAHPPLRRALAGLDAVRARTPSLSLEDAPSPRELLGQPARVEGQHVHALSRGVDRPFAAQRDALVDHVRLGGLRAEMRAPEEEEVGGLNLLEAHARGLRYLPGLFGGGAAEDLRAPGEAGDLVDAPREPRAVVAAVFEAVFGAVGR